MMHDYLDSAKLIPSREPYPLVCEVGRPRDFLKPDHSNFLAFRQRLAAYSITLRYP